LFVFIQNEPGMERVEHILANETAYIAAVSLFEIYYITLRNRGRQEADLRYALLRQTRATIVWELDEPTLMQAAAAKVSHNLPAADAIIAGTAIRIGATLVHRDPEFERLAGKVATEALPYKRVNTTSRS
jgi:predicted nucleic acid-binding protein